MTTVANTATGRPCKLVLHTATGKRLRLFTISLGFAIAGIWMIGGGDVKIGWLTTLLFGFASTLFAIELLWPGASYLELSRDGFQVCSVFRCPPLIRWETVSEFRTVRLLPWPFGKKMVGFDLGASYLELSQDGSRMCSVFQRAPTIRGRIGTLPDCYGRSPDELRDLMNQWQHEALTRIFFAELDAR